MKMAENLYQDKSVDRIKQDINKEFIRIESKSGLFKVRDDQEIYSAAIKTIDTYIQEIKKSKENYGPWALASFSELKNKFAEEYNKLSGWLITSSNENKIQINDLANRIDNAEKVVLERLARNRSHKAIFDANQSIEKSSGKSFFTFDKNLDIYKFTDASNKPNIHTVLGNFFKDDKNIYTIDYSECKNQKIKRSMITALGGLTKCLIKYDKQTGTYNLIHNGKVLPQRALIWEGVLLKTAESNMLQAQTKIRKNNEKDKVYNRNQFENSPKYKQLKELMPSVLKNKVAEADQWKLISETEKRLDAIIKEQKKLGWELEQDEPISKKGRSQIESHFVNTSGASKDIVIWEDSSVIGEDLYDILSGERDAYKTYLTARIKTKRGEADHLTKRRQIFSGANEKSPESDSQSREHFSYGLGMLSKLVNKLEDTHGTSQEVAALKVAIRNYQHSLEHGRPSQSDLNTAIAHLQTLFINYKGNDGSFSRITDVAAREKIKSLLIGDKTTAQRMIRELGSSLNVLGNDSTTFLRDEIADNEGIGFENTDYNQAFKNIVTQLDFQENESEENQKKKMQLIDQLYQNIDSTESVFSFLKSKEMLPKSADYKNEAIKEGCKKIQQALYEKQKQINSLEYNEANFREKLEQEKLNLEARMDSLSDEERIRYQTISVTLENPSIFQESLENAKNMAILSIKYGGIASLLKGSLAFAFAKNGGKMVGTNADIFNSSYGLNGFFDYSDETAVWMGELGQMLIEELAIAIVAIALGAVTGGAGAAAVYAGKAALTAARAARVANKANKIRKAFNFVAKFKSIKKYRTIGRETQKLMHAKSAISSLKTGTRIANKLDKTGKVLKGLKYADKLKDAKNTLKTLNQANKYVKLKDLAKVGKITDYLAKGTHLVFEGAGFHLSSTVLRNALHGNELSTGINPFGYTEGPNGEQLSNFKGYVQSVAFLGLLKAIGQPIQSLTGAGVQKIMGQKYSPTMLGQGVRFLGSIAGEMGALMIAEQGIHLTFEGDLAPVTGESLVQSLGLILGLRVYGWGKMKIINWGKGKLKVQNGNQEITVAETGEVLESNSSKIPKGTDLLSPKKQIKNRAEAKVESTTSKELSELIENFDKQIFSPEGILINGKNYKLQFEQNLTQNKGKKGKIMWIVDGQVRSSVQADVFRIPENSNGQRIRGEYYKIREQFVNENLKSFGQANAQQPPSEIKLEEQNSKKETQAQSAENKAQSETIKSEVLNEAPKDANDLALKFEKAEWDTASSYEGVKLDRVTKSKMDAQIFLLGVGKWFEGIGKARKLPNIPKKVLSQIRTKLGEIKSKFGNQLSNYYQRVWEYCKNGMKIFDAPRLERGSQTFEDGSSLEGIFRKGKLVSGKMMKDGNIFEGRFDKKGRLHGKGKKGFENGTIYEGEFKNGELIKGKKTDQYGHIYEGTFNKNGELSGEGVFLERDGVEVRGEFKNGSLDGRGSKYHPDGLLLQGKFKNGSLENGEIFMKNKETGEYQKIRDVKGRKLGPLLQEPTSQNSYESTQNNGVIEKIDLPNGTTFEGILENGMPKQGKMTFSDGIIAEGEFLDNLLHGKGELRYPDGYIETGNRKHGYLEGMGRRIDKGIIEEGNFEGGWLKKGKVRYTDGSIQIGEFERGKLIEGIETTSAKWQKRIEASNNGNLGFHGSDLALDFGVNLNPSAGSSKQFEGVSIAKDKAIAKGYALRSLIQNESGLEFRKGFDVNWDFQSQKYKIHFEGKSKNEASDILNNLKQQNFFIYEVAKTNKNWKEGVRNKNFGMFDMALNSHSTEWLTREKFNLQDLIAKGEVEVE